MSGVATFYLPNGTQGGNVSPQGSLVNPQQTSDNLQGGNITIQGSGAPAGVNISTKAPTPATNTVSTNGSSSIDAQIAALEAQIASANQKVYAPALDTNAIYSQASTTAANNVNPYYTKLLNDFITQQGVFRQQQKQQTAFNIQGLKDQLAQVQQAGVVAGNRATEDTATTEAGINQNADNRQIDQGTAFDTTRNQEAQDLAASGLTGSGLAAGKQATTQNTQDVTEGRQATADQNAKDAAELGKARTFEDIATSNTNATSSEAKGETQATFDLNNFITGQSAQLQGEQQDLEQQRQSAVQQETQNQTKILINNFINSISNPAQRQAAIQTYGGFA